jgi:hypothetical protein
VVSQVAGGIMYHLSQGYSIHEQLTDHDDRLRGLESSTQEQQSRLWPLGSGKSMAGDSWVSS